MGGRGGGGAGSMATIGIVAPPCTIQLVRNIGDDEKHNDYYNGESYAVGYIINGVFTGPGIG